MNKLKHCRDDVSISGLMVLFYYANFIYLFIALKVFNANLKVTHDIQNFIFAKHKATSVHFKKQKLEFAKIYSQSIKSLSHSPQ